MSFALPFALAPTDLPWAWPPARVARRAAVSTPRTELSDEALMLRFQGGDRACFVTLVRRHQAPLYNFVLRQVRVPSVAEDLVQDIFVRVVQSAVDFKHEARFSTWIYTIGRNLCIDHLRKMVHRRHPSLDHPVDAAEADGPSLGERVADASPEAAVDRQAMGGEVARIAARAVEELPPEQREVFLLREVGNVPFKDIAAMTGVPENTVKSRMRYALERLQQALADYEEHARALR